jgi:hypothetical protein
MARTPKLFSSSARHPKEGLLPCLLGGYRPSTATTSNPRPNAPPPRSPIRLHKHDGRVRIGREISRSADGAPVLRVLPRPSDRGDRSQSSLLSSTTLASHPLL